MSLQDRIEALIAPAVEAMGYEIVRVRVSESGQDKLVQILADRLDGDAITIDQCTDITHAVSAILDVEDPITSAYRLEVGSAGMDRPLTKAKDYDRFAGRQVKIETVLPLDGRRRFKGELRGIADQDITLETEEGTVVIPLGQVQEAKLIITDEMINEAKRRAKERAKA